MKGCLCRRRCALAAFVVVVVVVHRLRFSETFMTHTYKYIFNVLLGGRIPVEYQMESLRPLTCPGRDKQSDALDDVESRQASTRDRHEYKIRCWVRG
jgi:hypothetical protein